MGEFCKVVGTTSPSSPLLDAILMLGRMLKITACLFATVPVHAFYAQNKAYHHLFLLVTVMSILFHATHHPTIRKLDTLVAHIAFIFMLWETRKAVHGTMHWWLAFFPVAVACLWLSQTLFPNAKNALHAALHLVSIMGLHLFLSLLYSQHDLKT